MSQLKATHRKFTQSIYGWDVALIPNWYEQNIIDYMYWQMKANGMSATPSKVIEHTGSNKRGGKWQSGGVSRTVDNEFHQERLKFPHPSNWGVKVWHK